MKSRNTGTAALAVVLLLVGGCASRAYHIEHVAFASLVAVQTAIEDTRPRIESGELPAGLASPFNRLVDAYEFARVSGVAYSAGQGDVSDVSGALDALQAAWSAWQAARSEVSP